MGLRSLFRRKKPTSPSAAAGGSALATPLGSRSSSMGSRSRSQIEELEQVFRKFDANGDGKISASELGSIMGSLGHPETEEELAKMIREVDSDGDGFIDFGEFVEMNTKGVDPDEAMENLRDAFSVYDIDGDGSITAEELHKVLRSLGEESSLAECRRMIGGVDSDGDGAISFEEFKVMMMVGSRYDGTTSSGNNRNEQTVSKTD
ncbi:probable calcium-binding protein CML25 [Syzygium oleosum]|uniref:probable calcium-binding protein CML25 n=1 Tax=Syzygium oleosum TaxID=219896 RepID=UPI0011D2104D|nr:probable calcium-binding protein CML25 [Syzygium oleosum]